MVDIEVKEKATEKLLTIRKGEMIILQKHKNSTMT